MKILISLFLILAFLVVVKFVFETAYQSVSDEITCLDLMLHSRKQDLELIDLMQRTNSYFVLPRKDLIINACAGKVPIWTFQILASAGFKK